jgi:hypothetical protein
MQIRQSAAFIITVFAIACGVTVAGQEKQLRKSDLPAAMQKTVDEQSKGVTVKGYSQEKEGGRVVYEVAQIVNGHSKDITMDAQQRHGNRRRGWHGSAARRSA